MRLVVAGSRPQWLPRARSLRATSGGGPAACSARRGSDGVARHLHMGEQGLVEANAGFPHDSEVLQIPSRRADAFPCAQWGVCAHGSTTTYLDGDTEIPRFRGKVGPASLRPRSPMCSSPPRPGIVGPDPVMRLPDGRRTVKNLVLWSIDGTDEGCDRAVSGPTRPPTLRHSASPTFELDRSRRRRQRGLRGVAGGRSVWVPAWSAREHERTFTRRTSVDVGARRPSSARGRSCGSVITRDVPPPGVPRGHGALV